MKKSIVMSVLAVGIGGFADCATQGNDAFMVGVGGFSKVVCNEQGVKDLKDVGADFVRCIAISDRATLDLFEKYCVTAVAKGVALGWWGG